MTDQLHHNILFSCTDLQKRSQEQLVVEHSLGCIIHGEIHYFANQTKGILKTGSIGLIRRNQLAKTVKVPAADGTPFMAINVLLDQESLHRYSTEHSLYADGPYLGDPMVPLPDDPFIKGFFSSLMPYFDHPERLTQSLAILKTKEIIELLLRYHNLKNFLFDFREPHKIDLEAFMNMNYTYNVPLEQFAHLTGRSLSTFKRDFKRIFQLPPEKWLQQKRLEQAHFLISQKKQSPSEVYLDVGFENLSHFSTSFKKFYGYNASAI